MTTPEEIEQPSFCTSSNAASGDSPGRLALLLLMLILGLALAAFCLRRYNELQGMRQRELALLPLLTKTASRHSLPPNLVRAVVWRESRFRPAARGSKGEIGLMQLMPGAIHDWAHANRRQIPSAKALEDPETNLEIGCWYLARAQRQWRDYASCIVLLLAQYNAGRSRVLRAWAPKEKSTLVTPGDITYPTTRKYISSILRRKKFYDKGEDTILAFLQFP